MPQYPSERRASREKARVRTKSFSVWRCKGCGREFGREPQFIYGMPCCRSPLGYQKVRVKA